MLKIPARFKQCDLSVSLAFDYCDCIVNMGTRAAACKHSLDIFPLHYFSYHLRRPRASLNTLNLIQLQSKYAACTTTNFG